MSGDYSYKLAPAFRKKFFNTTEKEKEKENIMKTLSTPTVSRETSKSLKQPENREKRKREPKPPTKEVLFSREVWRQALKNGGQEIVFASPQLAHVARMVLYGAVRGLVPADIDRELADAIESLEIKVPKATPTTLVFALKRDKDVFKTLAAATGLDFDAGLTQTSAESLTRVQNGLDQTAELLAQAAAPCNRASDNLPKNPFFTRGE
jgi:hypothetical protein